MCVWLDNWVAMHSSFLNWCYYSEELVYCYNHEKFSKNRRIYICLEIIESFKIFFTINAALNSATQLIHVNFYDANYFFYVCSLDVRKI